MLRLITLTAGLFVITNVTGQTETNAGSWTTWLISSAKEFRLPAPSHNKQETDEVIAKQKNISAAALQQIQYWNAGAPGYHWYEMIGKIWTTDTSRFGALANMLVGTAVYDATIAAWDTKYAYKQPRPFEADKRIKCLIPKTINPSYPCEYSVAAGAAVTVISKFYPALADSAMRMANRMMESRIAAGVAYPSDTRAGFELGKKIAEKEIENTKNYVSKEVWDGKIPEGINYYKSRFALLPMAGKNKTAVLTSSNQFRPEAPADFSKDMQELKNFKRTFGSNTNAYFWASQSFWDEALNKKIFEYKLDLNAPKAASLYAVMSIGYYDGFNSCWDAKYAYWGIRPNQYDTTYKSLIPTPPFPGYPSGHAALSAVMAELLSHFFPADAEYFHQKAKEAAESRFQAGIHFRIDNDVALVLGKNVGEYIIRKLETDGDGHALNITGQKK